MRFYAEEGYKYHAPESFILEEVDKKHKRDSVTPKCELFFHKLRARYPSGIYAFTVIADYAETLGHSYLATVQWMRMLWKAGRVKRYYKGIYVRGLDGHSGSKWGIHYEW